MGNSYRSLAGCRSRFAELFLFAIVAGAFVSILLAPISPSAASQQRQETPGDEIVANLAAGRVIFAVVKDAILVATVEKPVEVQTRIPTPVKIGTKNVGIFLGAVEWISPSSHLEIANLDKDLPHLHGQVASLGPHLQRAEVGAEAADIDSIGHGVSERFNEIARNLHGKIDLPPNEPIAELILADYVEYYGPEIWQLTFKLKQAMQREDYFDTRVSLPEYRQIWPPEKGEPHTLVEFHYPPEISEPSLLDLIRDNNPEIEKLCSSEPKMRDVRDKFLRGESTKILSVDAIQFLRAALNSITPNSARETMASVSIDEGFSWILKPPAAPETKSPQKERPPDAPSLLHPQ